MFFGKQKFPVKLLKINKFIFNVKQLKMNKFIKSILQLIISTLNAMLEVLSLPLCKKMYFLLIWPLLGGLRKE